MIFIFAVKTKKTYNWKSTSQSNFLPEFQYFNKKIIKKKVLQKVKKVFLILTADINPILKTPI